MVNVGTLSELMVLSKPRTMNPYWLDRLQKKFLILELVQCSSSRPRPTKNILEPKIIFPVVEDRYGEGIYKENSQVVIYSQLIV